MRNIIEQLIREIPTGCYFDSHYIIRMLILKHSSEYNRFSRTGTLSKHGRIGQIIRQCNGVTEVKDYKSFSENIHARGSRCTLWLRK